MGLTSFFSVVTHYFPNSIQHVSTEKRQEYTAVIIDVHNLRINDMMALTDKIENLLSFCVPKHRLYLLADGGGTVARHHKKESAEDKDLLKTEVDLKPIANKLLSGTPTTAEIVISDGSVEGDADNKCVAALSDVRRLYGNGSKVLIVSSDSDLLMAGLCNSLGKNTYVLSSITAEEELAGKNKESWNLIALPEIAKQIQQQLAQSAAEHQTTINRNAVDDGFSVRFDFMYLSILTLGNDFVASIIGKTLKSGYCGDLWSVWQRYVSLRRSLFEGKSLLDVSGDEEGHVYLAINTPFLQEILRHCTDADSSKQTNTTLGAKQKETCERYLTATLASCLMYLTGSTSGFETSSQYLTAVATAPSTAHLALLLREHPNAYLFPPADASPFPVYYTTAHLHKRLQTAAAAGGGKANQQQQPTKLTLTSDFDDKLETWKAVHWPTQSNTSRTFSFGKIKNKSIKPNSQEDKAAQLQRELMEKISSVSAAPSLELNSKVEKLATEERKQFLKHKRTKLKENKLEKKRKEEEALAKQKKLLASSGKRKQKGGKTGKQVKDDYSNSVRSGNKATSPKAKRKADQQQQPLAKKQKRQTA